MNFERTRQKKVEVSLIPMIDMSMFLLIFFMVAGTIEKFEIIPIDPPVAHNGKLMDEGHVSVLLGRHQEIIVDDQIVSMADLQAFLGNDLKENPNKVITIKADATVSANSMIDVMDAIKAAGGRNLSVVTQSQAVLHVQ